MWRYNIVFLLFIGACCHAYGQNVVFTAVAGANKIGIQDRVEVQYTVKDAPSVQTRSSFPAQDFIVVGGPYESSSSYTSISGNRVTQSHSIIFTYVLQPKHEGTFTIPPLSVKDADGHTYQSNSLTIQVIPGSVMQQQQRRQAYDQDEEDPFAVMRRMQQLQQQQMQAIQQYQQQQQRAQPQAIRPQQQGQEPPAATAAEINKDLFIKVTVDKNKVHVGEQITTSYKLYARIPMQMSISKLPSLNGFWTQDFDLPKQVKPTEETLDGKKYQVFLLKKSALFPQQPGTLELDAAEAKGVARIVQQVRRSMADMFGGGSLMMNDPFFNNTYYNTLAYKDVKVDLKSAPVKITVTALPEKDKPTGFGNAVGSYKISSKIDKSDLTTDDMATLTLHITGSGNLKLIEAPKLILPNGLSSYDPQITDTITGRSTTISGSKIINYVITPHTPGDYDIPAIEFSYFNPQTGEYVIQHTEPFKLHVAPGKQYAAPAQTAGSNTTATLRDIHDIVKPAPRKIEPQSAPMLFTAAYWSMYSFPMLAFIGLAVYKRRDEELSQNTAFHRSKRANKIALQRLATAKKLLQQEAKKPFYEEISKAIWLYLSDKLNIPLSSLSRDTAVEALRARRVPDALQKDLENVIWECETALYASGGSKQMTHTYSEAIKVISDLEDVFKA